MFAEKNDIKKSNKAKVTILYLLATSLTNILTKLYAEMSQMLKIKT